MQATQLAIKGFLTVDIMVLRISLFLDNAQVNVQKHIYASNFTVSLSKYENIIFYISNKILRILCVIYIMNYIARAQYRVSFASVHDMDKQTACAQYAV